MTIETHTNIKILITKNPKPLNLNRYINDGEYSGPLVGATGYIAHGMATKSVILWDNDNPICRGYNKKTGEEKHFVNSSRFTIIDDKEFEKRKLATSDYGLKQYIKNVYNVDIAHTNMRLVSGISDAIPKSYLSKPDTSHTIFLGCRFHDITFIRTDLDSTYFINCLFTGITRRIEMEPFRNHVFVNCDGLPTDINDIAEAS